MLMDIAERLISRGNAKLFSRLRPDTAVFVGRKLLTSELKPTRDEIVKLLCDSKCATRCIPCMFKANTITNAYGQGTPDDMPKPKIEAGDTVTLRVPVRSTWEDGTITVDIGGQLVTLRETHDMIVDVVRAERKRRRGPLYDKPD